MFNKKVFFTVISAGIGLFSTAQVVARPEYVAPTGATSCDQCHNDNYGNGFKAGVLEAAASPSGKIAGLTAYIKSLNPPVVTGADTKPVLHPVNAEWSVTVGEAPLQIPLRVSDAEDDSVTFAGSTIPAGATIAAPTVDTQSSLQMSVLRWQPTAAQAGKSYTVTFVAKETGTARTLASNAVKATVRVWPARTSATRNVAQLIISKAQWNNNQLLLKGKVLFKSGVSATKRNTALATLQLNLKSGSGVSIGSFLLKADSSGNWAQTLALTAAQVPCTAKAGYEGLNVIRRVKLAPAAQCIK